MRKYSEQEQIRRKKLEALRSAGIDPYPARTQRDMTLHEVALRFDNLKSTKQLRIAGRIRALRGHGGSAFATIEDGTETFQVYLRKDSMGEKAYTGFQDTVDIGDIFSFAGTLFTTKKGEKTLEVHTTQLLAKALTPLPEKWHGLADVEVRYRRRHLDLIANPDVRATFQTRAAFLRNLRTFLDTHGFLEVETPMLQPIAGGAVARPFITHHNALDADFYLRIAPELYLKRLIVGGFERVYEIGKAFRNEGIDQAHSPEFTILEFYMAYADYLALMDFTEEFITSVLTTTLGTATVPYRGNKIIFRKPFARRSFTALLQEYTGVSLSDIRDERKRAALIKKFHLEVPKTAGAGKIADELYKEYIREKLVQPTFMIDHPIELSPLAKKKEEDPMLVERFQLIAGGMELVNAFSELNDPVDQEERFLAQQAQRKKGDEEAHEMDMEYVQALEAGMPPTAGFGLGVDRFLMMLTDTQNLKDVTLFPTLKPETSP